MKKIRLVELFAGIGSQAMALRDIGADFEHYRVVEFDRYAIASYNAIHGTNFEPQDIKETRGEDLGITEKDKYNYILTYSFPCQDLSKAGKTAGMKKGSGTRSGLLWEVERLLKETRELPQVLLMENVPQVHSARNKADFISWIKFLEGLGYCSVYADLNADDFGIPQNRNRCFMVSFLEEILPDHFLEVVLPCCPFPAFDFLEKDVDQKYYLQMEDLTNVKKIDDEWGVHLRIKQATKKGFIDLYAGGIADLSYPNSKTRRGRVQYGGAISPTLTASRQKMIYLESLAGGCKIRELTPREYWRLMGFKDKDFERAAAINSNTQLYKQAGNSIVKPVLMSIFSKIIEVLA